MFDNLRLAKQEDCDFLFRLASQKSSYFLFDEMLAPSLDDIKYLLANRENSYIIKGERTPPVGFIEFMDLGKTSRVYLLKIAFLNQEKDNPIIREAVNEIIDYLFFIENSTKIVMQCLKREKELRGFLETLSFVKELEQRDHFFDFGKYHSVLVYGLLRSDFKKEQND